MDPIDPQVAQRQRLAANVVRRKLREAGEWADPGSARAEAGAGVDACRIGLTLFCDSLFQLKNGELQNGRLENGFEVQVGREHCSGDRCAHDEGTVRRR